MYAGEPTVVETHTAMSRLFTDRYPRIKVEQVHTPSQFTDKIYNLAAGNALPDVFWGGGSNMIDYADRGILQRLKPLMQRDRLDTSDLYPSSMAHYEWKGEQYGLPRDWAARILFYNVDAFKQAGVPRPAASFKDQGWTWDVFLEAARKLTQRGTDGTARYGADVQGGFRVWNAWLFNNGGDVIDASQMACRLSDPASVDALQFLQDAIHKHQVAVPRDVLQKEGARSLFMNGRVALQEGTYGYMVQYKNIQLFEWDVAYMPIRSRRTPAVGGGGVCWMTSPQSKHQDEAWALMKHLIGFDAQLQMARMGGGASCLRRVMNHNDVARQRPPEHFTIFTEAGDHVRVDPPVLRWSQISGVLAQQMNDLWDGKRTAKDIAGAMCQGIEPFLAEQRR